MAFSCKQLWLLLVATVLVVPSQVHAQIVPDDTLGAESSRLIPDQLIHGAAADLIDGGAHRGGNLFHSFREFNITAGQRVYFANPADVESILSRVTGENLSEIFGTLGVDGSASLFLVNPNGLVFGDNAQLDIEGAFYGTTADGVAIGNALFSAITPDQRGLLDINPGVVFWNYLTADSGDIVSRGSLAVGGDLVLAAQNLDLQGQIAALGNVSLLATDGVKIRDTTALPFVALAGEDLLVQGNQQVDIVALSHPDSGVYSYGDMVLRSAERVGGDAHYLSGGSFRVEQLDGSMGELYSPNDPIIRSQGDVSFFVYQGASLHILAGGSVDIGTVIITGPDPMGTAVSPATTPNLSTVELSDGTTLMIDGSARPTLDVRAGVDASVIGSPLGTVGEASGIFLELFLDFFLIPTLPPTNNSTTTSANITIGDAIIAVSDGLVLLTNQYRPAANGLTGDIVINGAGLISTGIAAESINAAGGAVYLDARNNIDILDSAISTTAVTKTGDIVLIADDTVTFDGLNGTRPTGAFSNLDNLAQGETGTAGNIRIIATNLNILNGAQFSSSVLGRGQGGDIILNVADTIRFEGINPGTDLPNSAVSTILPNSDGNGGDIRIQARNLDILDGSVISTTIGGTGNGGDIILQIDETVRFAGNNPRTDNSSAAFSGLLPNGAGTGGDIRIQARNLEVLSGAGLIASNLGTGTGGNILLQIDETVRIEGTNTNTNGAGGVFNGIGPNGAGTGGDVNIQARNLEVLNGAQVTAATDGIGNAGKVILLIEETARFDGIDPIDGNASGAFSSIEPNGRGDGGDVRIQARNLEVLNGAVLTAGIFGTGNAGSVILFIEETARFDGINSIDGDPSAAFSGIQPGGAGAGGDVRLTADNVEISNGATLFSASLGQGNAGNVFLIVRNRLTAKNGTIATNAEQDAGGQIQIDAETIFLFDDSDIQTFVNSGENNGGNIVIRADALVAFDDSDILAFSADGRGGNVDLSQTAFFGQNFQFSPPGTDPRTLDNNDRVDINATGGIASGIVSLADISFIEDSLNELPDNLVNPETLVATSCVARARDTDSRLTITGRDSLEENPDHGASIYSLETVQSISAAMETTLAEPQGTYRLADGRLVLGRQCNRPLEKNE